MIIFLNRYFYPDHSATSLLLSDLAFGLAARDFRVAVVTSRQRYETEKERLSSRETIGGVDVRRVWTSRLGRHNLVGRSFDYLTFYVSAAWMLWRLARSGDIVIAKTDPPALSVAVTPIARLRGAKVINWLQDIFPEVAEVLHWGSTPVTRLGLRMIRALRDRSLTVSRVNVVLGRGMAKKVASLGVPEDRIRIIANWADGALVEPRDASTNALRGEWGLSDKFVIGYSGNLGRAHEYATFLDAIERIELGTAELATANLNCNGPARRDIVWMFIGGGALYNKFQGEVAKHRLKSVQFRPYMPTHRLAESLSVADIHLVSLRPELEGLVIPSKFYGIAAAGRPTIFVGDKDGEIAQLVAHHECGQTVAVGDGVGLARAVLDPAACSLMGRRARQAFNAEFDKPLAIARWEKLLSEVADGSTRKHQSDPASAHEATLPPRNAR